MQQAVDKRKATLAKKKAAKVVVPQTGEGSPVGPEGPEGPEGTVEGPGTPKVFGEI